MKNSCQLCRVLSMTDNAEIGGVSMPLIERWQAVHKKKSNQHVPFFIFSRTLAVSRLLNHRGSESCPTLLPGFFMPDS